MRRRSRQIGKNIPGANPLLLNSFPVCLSRHQQVPLPCLCPRPPAPGGLMTDRNVPSRRATPSIFFAHYTKCDISPGRQMSPGCERGTNPVSALRILQVQGPLNPFLLRVREHEMEMGFHTPKNGTPMNGRRGPRPLLLNNRSGVAIQFEILFLSPKGRVIMETISENSDPVRADVKGCSFSLSRQLWNLENDKVLSALRDPAGGRGSESLRASGFAKITRNDVVRKRRS